MLVALIWNDIQTAIPGFGETLVWTRANLDSHFCWNNVQIFFEELSPDIFAGHCQSKLSLSYRARSHELSPN